MATGIKKPTRKIDVVLGLPTYDGTFQFEMFRCLRLMIEKSEAEGVACAISPQVGAMLPLNRQYCVDVAFNYEAKFLLFIDSDMVFPPSSLLRLMKYDVDIVSGFYCQKVRPYNPHVYIEIKSRLVPIDEWPDDALIDNIDSVGAGFLLIKTDLLRKMGRPHFQFFNLPDGSPAGGEDAYFCRAARGKGIKIHVDTGLMLGHLTRYPVSVEDFLVYKENRDRAMAEKAAIERGRKEQELVKP